MIADLRRNDLIVVTPEHVEVRLAPAGLGSRFIAIVIDTIIAAGVTALAYRFVGALLPQAIGAAVFITMKFVITWGYHLLFETRYNGRSPGKRVMRLRVVDRRGLPITLQQSVVRNIVRVLDAAPVMYGVGGIAALIDRHNRRLGDLVADTLVVREELPMAHAPRFVVPRHFNTLRTPRVLHAIRHRVSLEEREFLLALCVRADKLEPRARYDLFEEVGAGYRQRLGIDDPHLSGENLVRDLTGLLFKSEEEARR